MSQQAPVSSPSTDLITRKAKPADASALCELYHKHLTSRPPKEAQDMQAWQEKIGVFEKDPHYHLLLGEVDGSVVSSVTLIVIENLTRNQRPYALIENVVTHADYRGKGYAAKLIAAASSIAKQLDCYKVMLMTGSKEGSTLNFYERCGFNSEDKTAFIKWLK